MNDFESTGLTQSEAQARLLDLLGSLYQPDVAQALSADLWALVSQPEEHPTGRTSLRSADTGSGAGCMLISYAHSLQDAGEVPLQTLHRFLSGHAKEMFSRVHLLPFYPSSSDDGFAVIDYRMVDHHVGSWEDVEALSADFDVMFDLVINHCSRENLWFADFIGGHEPGCHYFITLPEASDVSSVVRPRSTPLISSVHTYAGIRHVWNTFSDDQIDLDFGNPQVLLEFASILFFYVARGARLIRLDAIAFLWKRLGTSCMSLPETHVVVKILRLLLETSAEVSGVEVTIVTETNVPHDENVSYFAEGDEAHWVYQFPLAPLMLYAYVFADASYLSMWASRLAPPPSGCHFLNFLASHDGFGLRPLEGLVPEASISLLVDRMHERGGFVTLRDVAPGVQKPYEINITLFSALNEDMDAMLGAHTLLLSLQGVPAIYMQSLLAQPNDLDRVEQTGRTRSINRSTWDYSELTTRLTHSDSPASRMIERLKILAAIRESEPALAESAQQSVILCPPGLVALRRGMENDEVIVVASVLPQAQSVDPASLGISAGTCVELISGRRIYFPEDLQEGRALELKRFEVLWLKRVVE